jgi:hypothetical protein
VDLFSAKFAKNNELGTGRIRQHPLQPGQKRRAAACEFGVTLRTG